MEGRLVPTEASLARAEKRAYESAEVLLARILKERRRRWEEAELAKLKAAGKTPKDDKWKAKYEEPVAPDTTRSRASRGMVLGDDGTCSPNSIKAVLRQHRRTDGSTLHSCGENVRWAS